MEKRLPMNRPELTRLFENASRLPTTASREALLGALANLPRWYVIDLGSRDGILPLVADHGGCPSVYLFTEGDAAARLLELHGELPASARVVSLPTHEVSEFISGLRRWGVRTASFDPGPHEVHWRLDDLVVALWKHRPESLPDIDTLAARADLDHPQEQAGKLWQAVTSLPCWYFVADSSNPADPMVGICRDQPCALVFTDPVRARHHADLMDPSARREGNRLIALGPRQALWWFRSLATRGIAGAIFNDGPCAFFIPMGRMMAPVDAVRSVA